MSEPRQWTLGTVTEGWTLTMVEDGPDLEPGELVKVIEVFDDVDPEGESS